MESRPLFTENLVAMGQGDEDPETNERELVEAARQDPTAFTALYQLYFARVYRYLRMRVEVAEDAADLTQQVFLKALDALPRYQPQGVPFRAWLFTIARNALADRYRRRRPVLPLDAATEMEADREQDAESIVLRRESHERLAALLGELDVASRDLIALRFAAGLSSQDIAAIVGKRPEAVRKQLSRLLQALKEHYRAEY